MEEGTLTRRLEMSIFMTKEPSIGEQAELVRRNVTLHNWRRSGRQDGTRQLKI